MCNLVPKLIFTFVIYIAWNDGKPDFLCCSLMTEIIEAGKDLSKSSLEESDRWTFFLKKHILDIVRAVSEMIIEKKPNHGWEKPPKWKQLFANQ